jgi:putative transposase
MEQDVRQRKQIHLKHFDYSQKGYVYYVTLCVLNRQTYFKNNEIAQIIKDEINFRTAKKEIELFCYCIMPDHLHMLLSLHNSYEKRLQDWIIAFKRYTRRIGYQKFKIRSLWQRDFYEHIIRRRESLIEKAQYIVDNPVREGIVEEWEDYPHSWISDEFPE